MIPIQIFDIIKAESHEDLPFLLIFDTKIDGSDITLSPKERKYLRSFLCYCHKKEIGPKIPAFSLTTLKTKTFFPCALKSHQDSGIAVAMTVRCLLLSVVVDDKKPTWKFVKTKK